ncbi:RagB/SusD family nutrient uptake outer membrane protein [Marinoscillum luteum]|uniref:RagB/SusD family nutrient uptake outer membrane protein n=1 Tax=Marinoscillum luteum TaxID=861051 RepID=A0ABW7NEV5_9BACT
MKKIFYTILTAMVLSACSDLDIKPDGINTAENLFETEQDAEAAVNAMYASMQTHDVYNQFMEVVQSQGTDDAEWGYGRNTSNINKLQMDKFQFDASSDLIYRFWENHYKNINRTNIVLDRVADMSIDEEVKSRFLGEAHFLRAMMYFNMVRLFGKVPLVTKPTTTLEGLQVRRTSTDSVYQLIISDLMASESSLPTQYSPDDYGRPTKGAATALLAKVYLTNKEYDKAKESAQAVMEMGQYTLWPTYKQVFDIANENIGESIFEIQFVGTGGTDASVSSSYQGFFKPPASVRAPEEGGFSGYGDNPVTENHYNIYSPGDNRRGVNVLYEPGAPSSIQFPYYVNKYQDPQATNVSDGGNNYYILRYADVLLMYAEAENELNGPTALAYDAFNQIRRRGFGYPLEVPSPADLTAGLSKEQFLDSLMVERRREFAFEGQRRFDLLRWGKLKEAVTAQDPSILVLDKHLLFPIPEQERLVNDLLDQNDDY